MAQASILTALLKGALIGTGAILPGISGGVLCVALGVYQPVMALLVRPFTTFRENLRFYIPLLAGFALGVLGLSRLVDILFRASPVPAVWLFIGLIAGTLPALWRESGIKGRPRSAVALGAAAFAAMLLLLLGLQRGGGMAVRPGFGIWLLCGVLWGVGLIAPGLSPSSLFIFMGVYQPMAAGIADLSLPVLLPMGAGLLLCVLTLAHLIDRLLKNAYPHTMHFILGMALASTLAILPLGSAAGFADVLVYALCFAAGLAVALAMDAANRRMTSSGQKAD